MALTKKQKETFEALETEINDSECGYVHASEKAMAPFVREGLVEVNPDITDEDGNVAVRLVGEQAALTESVSESTPEVSTSFAIDDNVPLPTVTGRGRGGSAKYPFDQLEVGQSFFVPAEAKSIASSVSAANLRYAHEDPSGETRVNRKGNTVPVMVFTRQFTCRSVEKNGLKGSRVWRTA